MTYKTGFLRMSFLFSVANSDEVADTSLKLADPAATVSNYDSVLADWTDAQIIACGTALATMMANTEWGWADYSSLTSVKLAALDTTGHYTAAPRQVAITGHTGAKGNTTLPQATCVVSLRTPSTFGVANYGRMYIPHTAPRLDNYLPKMSGATQTALGTQAVTFLQAVNAISTAVDPTTVISNMSKKDTGTTRAITQIAIGEVVDTQRRRRNQLSEDYAFTSL